MTKKNHKSAIDIDHVAKLAELELKGEEKKTYSDQLSKILDYIEQIEKADTKDTEPTFNVSENKNIQREDIVGQSLSQEDATRNAKSKKDGFIVTKGIFENEDA